MTTRWECPRCPRRIDDPTSSLVTGRACQGHPVTGATHELTEMTRRELDSPAVVGVIDNRPLPANVIRLRTPGGTPVKVTRELLADLRMGP